MSCAYGKVSVIGIEEVGQQRVFVLKFLQARIPSWTSRVFFAEFDPHATWFDELRPAFGQKRFFFEEEYAEFLERSQGSSSGQMGSDGGGFAMQMEAR
jgi:hypothetical protein